MLGLSVAQSMGAAHTAVIRVHKNVCAGYTRRTRPPTQCLHRTKHARLMSAVWGDTEFLDSVCNEALFQQVNAGRILFFFICYYFLQISFSLTIFIVAICIPIFTVLLCTKNEPQK